MGSVWGRSGSWVPLCLGEQRRGARGSPPVGLPPWACHGYPRRLLSPRPPLGPPLRVPPPVPAPARPLLRRRGSLRGRRGAAPPRRAPRPSPGRRQRKGRWRRRLRPGPGAVPFVAMWSVLWTAVRTHAPYVTFPVAFVVGAVGYHLEWFLRGRPPPPPEEEEKSISERREDRKLQGRGWCPAQRAGTALGPPAVSGLSVPASFAFFLPTSSESS
uniref:Small integral membrane protein 12 n=1 Tax=Anser cygnoides TaxID=8845 RepID=A0A8B9DHE5_ANSCY